MTKVLLRPRHMTSLSLSPADAMRFRLGDQVELAEALPWWTRAVRWVLVAVFRRQPLRLPALHVRAVDHATGVVTLELLP